MDQQHLQELDMDLAAEEATIINQLKSVGIENPAVKGDFEPTQPTADDNDEDERINDATELDRDFAMEQQLEKRLKEIRSAREQIAQGKYGQCVNCASPIASERLQAMPAATLCISCATKA